MMQPNSKLIQDIYESFNQKDINKALQCMSEQLEWTVVPSSQTYRGREGYREYEQNWMTAFPDGKVEVTHFVELEDQLIVEYTGRGTHTGVLMTSEGKIPPTQRRVELKLCDVMELKNGQVTKGRTYFDAFTLMTQLGVLDMKVAA